MRAAVIRLLLVSVFGLVLSCAYLRAHQPAPDPWGFEEEQAETLGDVIRPQVLDLVILTGFFSLALVSFFRKSVALKYAVFVLAIGYTGFYKSYLLSIVNVFGVLDWNFPIFKYNLAWYLFFLFAVVSTVLFGRLYCGRICAYGALTQLMDAVIPAKLRIEPPAWLEKRASKIKFVILGAVVVYFLATRNMSIYKYVEPFWMFGLNQ